VKPTWQRR